MVKLSTLVQLVESFAAPSLEVDAAHCLNARYNKVACTRCADACPTQAITVAGPAVTCDLDACARCGLCLWACPTGVFHQTYPPEDKLPAVIARQDTEALELVCPAAREAAGRLPEARPVATPRCLAALSPARLIELADPDRTIWLNDSLCADCPLAAAHEHILSAAQEANAWLTLYERAGRIRLFTEAPPRLTDTPHPERLVDGSSPPVDRRAFLRGNLRGEAGLDVAAQPVQAANPVSDRLGFRLPPERVRLLRQESAWPEPPNRWVEPEPLGLAAIEIDEDNCSLCGWCAGFCPTAALQWQQQRGELMITFQPLRCIDCDICLAACPTEAVHKREQIPSGALRQTVLLAEGESHDCTRCGRPTAVRTGDLCVWCSHLTDTRSILEDVRRRYRPPGGET